MSFFVSILSYFQVFLWSIWSCFDIFVDIVNIDPESRWKVVILFLFLSWKVSTDFAIEKIEIVLI